MWNVDVVLCCALNLYARKKTHSRIEHLFRWSQAASSYGGQGDYYAAKKPRTGAGQPSSAEVDAYRKEHEIKIIVSTKSMFLKKWEFV